MKEIRQDAIIGVIIAVILVLSGTTWWLWERVEQLASNIAVLTEEDLTNAVFIPGSLNLWKGTQNGSEDNDS